MPNLKNVILVVKQWRVVLCLVLAVLCTAQASSHPHRLRFYSLGVNEGLSHNSVYSLLQDSRGFIWMGTADGLNRYDGKSIKVYRSADAENNPDAGYIRDRLVEDKQGNIWYATAYGIYCWDKNTERVVKKRGFKYKSLAVYFLSDKGELWLHDLVEGVSSYNIYTGKMVVYPYPSGFEYKKFKELKTTANGTDACWFSIYGTGPYYRFDTKTLKYEEQAYGGKLVLLAFENGGLWLSDGKQVEVLDAASRKVMRSFAWKGKPLVKAGVLADIDGYTWISAYGDGLYSIDGRGAVVRRYQHSNQSSNTPSSDNITCLVRDRGDNLWMATDGGGVSRADLKAPQFMKFPQEERDYPELKSVFTWALLEDESGKIWFATDKGGLNIYDPVSDKVQQLKLPLIPKNAHIQVICQPFTEDIWIGFQGGVGYLHNGKLSTVSLAKPASNPAFDGEILVYKILARGRDTLLIGTSAGIRTLTKKNGRWAEISPLQETIFYSRTTDIIQEGPDSYWLSFPNIGLCLATYQSGRFKIIDSFLPSEAIRSIYKDETDANLLWLCSKSGLWKLDVKERKARLLNTKNGLANANVYGVLVDANHKLWMSTNGGLSSYDRTKGTFSNYNYSSGLQSNEFNSGAFHKGASGKLYFGGVKGFNWLDGEHAGNRSLTPGVIVTGITAGDSILMPFTTGAGVIRLSYRENSFGITAVLPDYTRPESNYIQYKLEGWDKELNTSQTGDIRYSNLPPGDYKLKLYGVAGDKGVSAPYILDVKVVAPFWERSWFKLLLLVIAVATVILSVYLASREKVKKALRELERQKLLAEERNRISRDLHDDIGSAITRISLISELIPLQHKGAQQVLEDVKVISATAREVSQSMSEIVWALHAQHDTLESLLSYLREQIREFLAPVNMEYTLDFPDEPPAMKINGEQRRNILLVTKEALNNALKYAHAGEIRISCRHVAGKLVFKVVDDGGGFDLQQVREHGNGLKNMKRRMELIGGALEILQPGRGTCVAYSIPV